MLVCVATNCVLPAAWQAVLTALPAAHWGEAEQRMSFEICFCEVHRAAATLDSLFTPAARRGLDGKFLAAGLPVPDWSRSKLHWRPLPREAHKRALFTYTIYDSPTDFPMKFPVRRHAAGAVGAEVFVQDLVGVADTLEAARALVPAGHVCMARMPDDDPKIVEVWL